MQAPAAAQGGDTITVSWTVQNRGLADALPGGWVDRVYLSDRPDYTAEGARALLLGEKKHRLPLSQGASYSDSLDIELSAVRHRAVPGGGHRRRRRHHALPAAARCSSANSSRSPSSSSPSRKRSKTTMPPPRRRTSRPSPPTWASRTSTSRPTTDSGEPVTIRYTVTNVGRAPRLERDQLLEGLHLAVARRQLHPHPRRRTWAASRTCPTDRSEPGESYKVEFNTTLPEGTGGRYYLYIHLDAHNDCPRCSSRSRPACCRPTGGRRTPAPTSEWLDHFDRWAFEDPTRQPVPGRAADHLPRAGPEVTDLQIPAGAPFGRHDPRHLHGHQPGHPRHARAAGPTASSSPGTPSLDPRTTLLATVQHGGVLAAASRTPRRSRVRLPDGIEGDFYVLAFTDSAADVDRAAAAQRHRLQLDRHRVRRTRLAGGPGTWRRKPPAAGPRPGHGVPARGQQHHGAAAADHADPRARPADHAVTAPAAGLHGPGVRRHATRSPTWAGHTVPGQHDWDDLIYLSRDRCWTSAATATWASSTTTAAWPPAAATRSTPQRHAAARPDRPVLRVRRHRPGPEEAGRQGLRGCERNATTTAAATCRW